jgi:hypothetical protein
MLLQPLQWSWVAHLQHCLHRHQEGCLQRAHHLQMAVEGCLPLQVYLLQHWTQHQTQPLP